MSEETKEVSTNTETEKEKKHKKSPASLRWPPSVRFQV